MDKSIEEFASFLAEIPDPKARERAIKQANLLALKNTSDEVVDAANKPPIKPLGVYLDTPIELPPTVIHPFIAVRGGLNVTVGRAGKGKTVMSLNRILRWSAGLPWLDTWHDPEGNPLMYPDGPIKILVVENEGAAGMFHHQIKTMVNSETFVEDRHREKILENVLIWGEGGYSGMKLDDSAKLQSLRDGVDEWRPDLVFIEPFRSLWSGDENSSTDMTKVTDALIEIATDFNCAVWASHHEKKGGFGGDDKMSAARGSTVLEGAVTTMENFEESRQGIERVVSWSKMRHGVAPPEVTLAWNKDDWWYSHVANSDVEDAIMFYLAKQENMSTVEEIAIETKYVDRNDRPARKIREALRELVDAGKIVKGQGAGNLQLYAINKKDSNGSNMSDSGGLKV